MDMDKIDQLADLMERHGLTRVRLEEGDGAAVELECQPAPVVAAPIAQAVAPAPAQAPVAGATAAQPAGASEAPVATHPTPEPDDTYAVTAPMVGVFYAAPSPGGEPFVKVGSHVHKGDTLCVIEAMKLMNEVTAERDGEVAEVCAEDGELVEFGRTLMRLK